MHIKIYTPNLLGLHTAYKIILGFFGKRDKSFICLQRPDLQGLCSRETAKKTQPLNMFNCVMCLFNSLHLSLNYLPSSISAWKHTTFNSSQWKIQRHQQLWTFRHIWNWRSILITLKFIHEDYASPPAGAIFIRTAFRASLPYPMLFATSQFSAMTIISLLTPWTPADFLCFLLPWNTILTYPETCNTEHHHKLIIFLPLYVQLLLFINTML